MTKKNDYNESDIKVLEGLDPVRLRPGMYTDCTNPNHMIQEVVDNASDEALAKFASKIKVIIQKDGTIEVEDDGRGIPTGIHPTKGVPTVQVVFTTLHAGGKFDKENGGAYAFSGGLHGVGVSVTNALSTKLEVIVSRDGKQQSIEFANGEVSKKLNTIKKIDKNISGTKVIINPDMSYFDEALDHNKMISMLRAKAVLLPGVTVELTIHKGEKSIDYSWNYPDGLADYLKEIISEKSNLTPIFSSEKFFEEDESDSWAEGEGASWAISWAEGGSSHKESYVNLIPTKLGGTHESGFKTGAWDAVKSFIEQHAMMPRGVSIVADDLWHGVNFVLSAKVLDPQFHGQTKEKLNNRSAVRMISQACRDQFEHWLHENPEIGKTIAEMTISAAQARARKGKTVVKKKTSGLTLLPGKLTDCESKDINENEIFIVEGDSAGGSAKMGREKRNQAILPLKGKPQNTWEVDPLDLMGNKEIQDISMALGVEVHELGDEKALENLRYGKVCILSDADKDGHHIQVLLICLFMKHFPELIKKGHVYIAQPPLYRVDIKGYVPKGRKKKIADRKVYVLDDEELQDLIDSIKHENIKEDGWKKIRFKGLGEMSPAELWETTLDPETRRLCDLVIPENQLGSAIAKMEMLLGKKRASDRKTWIEDNGDFGTDEEVEG